MRIFPTQHSNRCTCPVTAIISSPGVNVLTCRHIHQPHTCVVGTPISQSSAIKNNPLQSTTCILFSNSEQMASLVKGKEFEASGYSLNLEPIKLVYDDMKFKLKL